MRFNPSVGVTIRVRLGLGLRLELWLEFRSRSESGIRINVRILPSQHPHILRFPVQEQLALLNLLNSLIAAKYAGLICASNLVQKIHT